MAEAQLYAQTKRICKQNGGGTNEEKWMQLNKVQKMENRGLIRGEEVRSQIKIEKKSR